VRAEAVDILTGKIKITNRRLFAPLAALEMEWELVEDGVRLATGNLPCPEVPAGSSREVSVAYPKPAFKPGCEYYLNISFRLAQDTLWAKRGHEVAWAQFALPNPSSGISAAPVKSAIVLSSEQSREIISIHSEGFSFRMDAQTGIAASLRYHDKERLVQGPVLNLWRAPTDNDGTMLSLHNMATRWRDAGLDRLQPHLKSINVQKDENNVLITVQQEWRAAMDAEALQQQRLNGFKAEFSRQMATLLSLERLQAICNAAGVHYDSLPGRHAAAKIRALLDRALNPIQFNRFLKAVKNAFYTMPAGQANEWTFRYLDTLEQTAKEYLTAKISPLPDTCIPVKMKYQILPYGEIDLEMQMEAEQSLPPLPRVGVRMTIPNGYETFTWYGRGPHETYSDRQQCGRVGLYHGSVDEQFVEYVYPQENGNKTDVRWAALSDAEGDGLLVVANPLMNTSVHHYTAMDLTNAKHTCDLIRRDEITFNLDLAQCGLGSASCGPGVLPQYLLQPGAYTLKFTLRPFSKEDGSLSELARQTIHS